LVKGVLTKHYFNYSFTPVHDHDGDITITSEIFETENGKCVEITVKDNGIGISAANSDKIFEAFQRLHQKGDYAGNGLILSLYRKIAGRHHGSIMVLSEENAGTAFVVTLPLKQDGASLWPLP